MRSLIITEKVDPKNECLQLKTLKAKKLVWSWRLDINARNIKHEDFCFRSFIFSFLSHRKHRTVKGGRGKTKEKFKVMLISKSYTYESLSVKPLEISYSSVNFFSDKYEELLFSEESVLNEELGICECGLPTSEEHDSPEEFGSSNFRLLLCYAPTVQNILPT